MEAYDVYKDISERTNGSIFVAVVGPVRTGKSTLISKMMDSLVLPNIEDPHEKQRVIDEMPQSGAGKTIMTTQPKFVPNEAVAINIDDKAKMKIRMVDCVGYLVDGAIGQNENEAPRMVRTPWFDYDIPFEQAAEIGTRKVIDEHATVGIVMMADESVAGIPRSNYAKAEERVVEELKANGKPFVIVLNSAHPESQEAQNLRDSLQEKYQAPVLLLNAMEFTKENMNALLSDLLYEFPIKQVDLNISSWLCALDKDHWLLSDVLEKVNTSTEDVRVMRDFAKITDTFDELDYVKRVSIDEINMGDGTIRVEIDLQDALFYKVLGEECGCEIRDDSHLVSIMKDLVVAKREYDHLESAMQAVKSTGYGIVSPMMDELSLEEPELVQQGNKFGVRLKGSAPSLHIIRVDVETEVSPIVGTEMQSKELIDYLMAEFKTDPTQIWSTDIFGKSLSDIVKEGLSGKITNIPEDAREKIQETLQRMVNEGDGGMLCILL
ncbi:MAG: stage IV sporulation protein A [Clostridiales bacterium]|nr:stage IV sporulation protein A [Clostridiales bacterium]